MPNHQRPYIALIKITLLALIVSALPLPKIALDVAPFWVLLFFTCWIITFTTKGQFFFALGLGVLIDVLYGDILGQNALALILSSVFINNVKQSLLVSNITTQQIYLFAASIIYLAVLLLVHGLSIQDFSFNAYLLLKPFLTALLWPVVQSLLSKLSS